MSAKHKPHAAADLGEKPSAAPAATPAPQVGRRAGVLLLLTAATALGLLSALVDWRAWLEKARPAGAALPGLVENRRGAAPDQTLAQSDPQPPRERAPLDPLIPDSGKALLEEAARVARDLVDRFPQNPDAHEMFARYHFEFGDLEKATAAWRRCLELNPHYAYAHVGLAQAAGEAGEFDQAVTHYRRAVLADPGNPSHQTDLGKALLAAGEVDEAIAVLQGAVKMDPRYPRAYVELGAAQLQKRDYQAAKTAYETALRLDPRYATAHYGLATACARLGEAELAREHEAKFREFRTERHEELRGQRLAYRDDQAQAEDIARRYTEMGRVYLAGGLPDVAEQMWRRAARLHAGNIESRKMLAWLYVQQGRLWETIRTLHGLAQLEPDNPAYPLEIARLYLELQRPKEARRTLETFVEDHSENAQVHAALAEFYLNAAAQPESAIEHAQRAAELSPAAPHWALLGAAHDRAGQWPQAVAALEQATQLAPDNPQYRQLLALFRQRAILETPKDAAARRPSGSSAAAAQPPAPDDEQSVQDR